MIKYKYHHSEQNIELYMQCIIKYSYYTSGESICRLDEKLSIFWTVQTLWNNRA